MAILIHNKRSKVGARVLHDERFKVGARVLQLIGRHKDGAHDCRRIQRASYEPEQFDATLDELISMLQPGERIYACANQRNMKNAVREFKTRQLNAEYDDDPYRFYRHLGARWHSSLMSPRAQMNKLWLFDCDSADEYQMVLTQIDRREVEYSYNTKNGMHLLVKPFDRTKICPEAAARLHTNPLILWAY